ncbi:hypothetical protein NQ176_g8025 [Zarea fungicola]|uniref:Uncharacterized protein n=1 Tax=Zarea fungicola TaxID=93591 RepID=A0ACC1MX55_9HYPO|nr:hypothetical protein NQ176_g8025 [Lecanicillium fungicola]
MAPIRTAIIGLSGNSASSWASAAHLPYLLSKRGRTNYQIVALCNSSVEAAKQAIEEYSLPTNTKAYGNPDDLAQDADIDLVVVVTRVDVHYKTALPSIRAGKKVFVEWPLAQDVKHAQELADAAAAYGSHTLVGHQGRFAPVLLKVREVLESGRIGKVLSSDVRAFDTFTKRDALGAGAAYFADLTIGGNGLTITFGHCMFDSNYPKKACFSKCDSNSSILAVFDQVQHVLGDLQNPKASLQLLRPQLKLIDAATTKVTGEVTSNVPDLLIVSGSLHASKIVQQGATLSLHYRRGGGFKGDAPLVWTINGEKGELRLTAENGPTVHAASVKEAVSIEVHDYETDTVEKVDWDWSGWETELPLISRSIGTLYDKFSNGSDDAKDGLPTFQTALQRHKQLEEILLQWRA